MDKGIITKERKSTLKETKRNEWSIHYDTNSSYKRSCISNYKTSNKGDNTLRYSIETFRCFEYIEKLLQEVFEKSILGAAISAPNTV